MRMEYLGLNKTNQLPCAKLASSQQPSVGISGAMVDDHRWTNSRSMTNL